MSVAESSAKEILESQLSLIPSVRQQLKVTFWEARPTFNTFQSTGMNSPLSSHNGKSKASLIEDIFKPMVPQEVRRGSWAGTAKLLPHCPPSSPSRSLSSLLGGLTHAPICRFGSRAVSTHPSCFLTIKTSYACGQVTRVQATRKAAEGGDPELVSHRYNAGITYYHV